MSFNYLLFKVIPPPFPKDYLFYYAFVSSPEPSFVSNDSGILLRGTPKSVLYFESNFNAGDILIMSRLALFFKLLLLICGLSSSSDESFGEGDWHWESYLGVGDGIDARDPKLDVNVIGASGDYYAKLLALYGGWGPASDPKDVADRISSSYARGFASWLGFFSPANSLIKLFASA